MSTHILPRRKLARWFLGATLAAFPMLAVAEVTLTTSVERVSSGAPADNAAARTPDQASSSPAMPSEVFPGDVLRYTIVFENTSTQDVAAGSVVITNPIPDDTVYVEGSALGRDTRISYSVDGQTFGAPAEIHVGEGAQARAAAAADYRAIRWAYEPRLPAGASSEVSFELLIP